MKDSTLAVTLAVTAIFGSAGLYLLLLEASDTLAWHAAEYTVEQEQREREALRPDLVLHDVSARELKRSYGHADWTWKADVENCTDRPKRFYLEIKYLDKDGYQLERSNELGTLQPGRHTLTATDRMVVEHADQVVRYVATIALR